MRSWSEVAIPSIDSTNFPALQLTNSASGKKELVPPKPLYRMYVCGITPYDATHLGHAATYLTFDLINRYLRASGSEVRYVQNITDIDDPLLERAKRDGVDWTELAHKQIELFRGDMVKLRVIPPADYIGAVDAIPLVSTAIEELVLKESIYTVDNDLYFKVHKDRDFGQRSHLSKKEMLQIFSERGGDPDRVGKSDPLDCLVWMSQRPNEPGWPSPFGVGRPGWHIECTAIAIKYLAPSPDDESLVDIILNGLRPGEYLSFPDLAEIACELLWNREEKNYENALMVLRHENTGELIPGLSNEFVLKIVQEAKELDLGYEEDKEELENFVSEAGIK